MVPFRLGLLAWASVALLFACSDDSDNNDEDIPTLRGIVVDVGDDSKISSANVVVVNLNTNATVARQLTGVDGAFSIELDSGTYTVEIQANGYYDYPATPGGGIVVTLPSDSVWTITMKKNASLGAVGAIRGTVDADSGEVSGTLLVAVKGDTALSTAAGPDGGYVLYNLTPGIWSIEAYKAGFRQEGNAVSVTVEEEESKTANISLLAHKGAKVTGNVSFLSTTARKVDVTLVHPVTRKAIPGLSVLTDAGNSFRLVAVPPGEYIAWASYQNDSIVMDPDWIRKSGLPALTVLVADTALQINFSCTGAIDIKSPSNPMDSLFPVEVDSVPVFTWIKQSSYASATEYILEVLDDHGNRIWGGYNAELVALHQVIPEEGNMSISYNFDGSATVDTLPPGDYRWKVYAVKEADKQGVISREILSASEDLMGLFRIVE